jgi:hypothetical protein
MENSSEKNGTVSPAGEKKMRKPSRHYSRDCILQKKVRKSLPDNFFEKVLELELRIKRDFTMEILTEIVNLYTSAIEWYESIEDSKYKDYQNRLNILLSQPDILKCMNEYYLRKGEKDLDSEDYAQKLRKEQEKNQIKMKVNYITQISNFNKNTDQVLKIIETYDKDSEKKEEVENNLNEEIHKQQDSFKARLEEKRKKQSSMNLGKLDEIRNKKRGSLFLNEAYGYKPNRNQSSSNVLSGFRSGFSGLNANDTFDDEGITSARTKKTEKTEKTEKTDKTIESDVSQKSEDNISEDSENESDSDGEGEGEGGDNLLDHDGKLKKKKSAYFKPIIQIDNEMNLDNSFDKFEQYKINEIEEMLSPINMGDHTANNADKFNISLYNNKSRDNSMIISKFEENVKFNETFIVFNIK